jgi:hypothetical protein
MVMVLLLLLLACGPLNRLQDFTRKGQVLATGVAIMGEGNYLAFDAYENLQGLPGYRLEIRSSSRDQSGYLSNQITTSEHDAQGNVYTLTRTPAGRENEIYFVDGHTYVFEAQYNGWVELGTVTLAEAQQNSVGSPAGLSQTENFMQLLPQFGAVPTEAGHETIQDRAATRYELEYITAELAETFGNQVDVAIDLQGTLWIDDQTRALLKSEILLYDNDTRQPRQEFLLEVTEIGNIEPIVAPEPVVNPAAIVSATATSQAWSLIQAELNYGGQPIFFELIPVQVSQATAGLDAGAEMQLILRQIPPNLLATETELFLTELGRQLSMSIPKYNMIIASDGFQITNVDSQTHSVEVIYLFKANLEDFSHVELVLASSGNPIFAPVPVAGNE